MVIALKTERNFTYAGSSILARCPALPFPLFLHPPWDKKKEGGGNPLDQPFSSQLYLPPSLPFPPSPLRDTNRAPFTELELIFRSREGAGTMMGKMDASEGSRAEVVAAVCYIFVIWRQYRVRIRKQRGKQARGGSFWKHKPLS